MLKEIKGLFENRECISLYEVAQQFHVEESAMELMLETLVKKGYLKRNECLAEGGCGGCSELNCHRAMMLLYSKAAKPEQSDEK